MSKLPLLAPIRALRCSRRDLLGSEASNPAARLSDKLALLLLLMRALEATKV
jgi:hypothetical protein